MLAIIFAHLYAFVPVLSIMAYTPQILTLMRSPGPAKDICLRSWLIWAISGLVTLGYGAYCLHDRAFCVVTLLSLLPMLMILGIVIYKRDIRVGKPRRMEHAPIRVRTDP
jgi:hypothetical protein